MAREVIQLRPYQTELTDNVRAALARCRRVLLQAPTGSGKTWLIAFMILRAASRGLRVWFVVHRRELLEQTCGALRELGVEHGVIGGGRASTSSMVQVATIQTLARRIGRMAKPNLMVIDEAHHTPAASYKAVMDACPDAWIVGLTATPVRTDGRGLADHFEDLVLGPSVAWLMEQGYLARYRLIAPPAPLDLTGVHIRGGDYVRGELEQATTGGKIMGDAIEHYREYVRGPCLVYCVSRHHARLVEAAYRDAGIDAHYCAGDTDDEVRTKLVRGFRSGQPPVLVSVDLFGEGLDAPGLAAVQLLRPTASLGLHLQQIGRALRPEPGKRALILDHVGNSWKHGLPDCPREWTLEGRPKQEKETAPALRLCKRCFSMYAAGRTDCPVCGLEHVPEPRMPDIIDGKLSEIDPETIRAARKQEEKGARSLEDLVRLALSRGYSVAWAGVRHAIRLARARGKMPTPDERKEAIKEAQRIAKDLAA